MKLGWFSRRSNSSCEKCGVKSHKPHDRYCGPCRLLVDDEKQLVRYREIARLREIESDKRYANGQCIDCGKAREADDVYCRSCRDTWTVVLMDG